METTLLKGLQVLDLVTRTEGKLRSADVAASLNLTKSNAYRLLRTLESAGYLKQDMQTKQFEASLRLWELGIHVIKRLDIRAQAAAALQKLADDTRETVHLATLDGFEVIYIDKIDSPEPVSAYTRLGGRAPAYCVATGKAMLSQLPADELEPLLGHLEAHSESTITDLPQLQTELMRARMKGYAVNRGEWRDSVWGVAAPVRHPGGAFAIGISGPKYRMEEKSASDDVIMRVIQAAEEISRG